MPPAATVGIEPQPCPSNQLAPDGTCLVSPEATFVPPPPPLPPPAAIVVNPPPPAPVKDEGPPAARGPKTGLLAGGLALFAVGYGATIGINYGVCGSGATWDGCDSKALSFVPVVGSFILAGAEDTEMSYRVLAVSLGLTQALGAVLFGMSFAGASSNAATKQATHVVPQVGPGHAGASVIGQF